MSTAAGPVPEVLTVDRPDPVVVRDGRAILIGGRCPSCGSLAFPHRPTCASCQSTDVEPTELAPTGTIYTHSTVSVGAGSPYTLAYVDLDDGVRFLARVRGDVSIGARTAVVDTEGEAIVVEVSS